MTEFLLYFPLGVVAGFLAGLFGIGGGVIFVPVLLLGFEFFGMQGDVMVHIAVGTSLACVLLTGSSSAWAHYKKQGVNIRWALSMTPFLIVGGVIGGWTADQLPGAILKAMLGMFLLLVSAQLFLRKNRNEALGNVRFPAWPIFGLSGTFIGWLSAMMGIGGGALMVPYMNAYGASIRQAIGTASATGIPIALSGVLSFIVTGLDHPGRPDWSLGYIYIPAFLGIVVTSTFAARLGANVAHRLDQHLLQRMFACLLAFLSMRLIWNSIA